MIPIFVINLDDSPHRLEKVQSELAKHQQAFERVSAVDGRRVDIDVLHQHYSEQKNKQGYYKTLTRGEIACYLSHRKVWQMIVDRKLPFAIVLEDDIVMNRDISDIELLTQSGRPFDYVKLSDHPGRPRKTKHVSDIGTSSLVRFNKVPARTCAQLVSLKGAEKLLKASEQFGRPIDIDLQYWWEKDLDIFGLQPFVFSPAPDIASDISAVKNRSDLKKHRLRRLKQQCLFALNNALRKPNT